MFYQCIICFRIFSEVVHSQGTERNRRYNTNCKLHVLLYRASLPYHNLYHKDCDHKEEVYRRTNGE